jgi:hypothetical protein
VLATLILVTAATLPDASAQVHLSAQADHMLDGSRWGYSGKFLVGISDFRYDAGVHAGYFPQGSDSTNAWTVGLQVNLNLITIGALRPYLGTGSTYLKMNEEGRFGFDLHAGVHARLSYRLLPFAQATYRVMSVHPRWYLQFGIRFALKVE